MIRQIILAAGGVGSRMSDSVNPNRSKSLIEYDGKPLIQYLLESAKKSGFEEVFISVNKHNKDRIEELARLVGLPFKTKLTTETYRGVPGLFVEHIEEKVIIACGHHFIPPEYFKALQESSEKFDSVFSSYRDPPNTYGKNMRILAHGVNGSVRFEAVDLKVDKVPSPHVYVRTPYIVTTDMICQVELKGYEKAVGYYAYQHWKNGGKVTALEAMMPPEFDFDSEFERTKQFMDGYFRQEESTSGYQI